MGENNSFFKYLNPKLILSTLFTEIFTLIVGTSVACIYLLIFVSSTPIYLYRFLLFKISKYLDPTLGKMVTARGQFFAIEKFTSKPGTSPHPRYNAVAAFTVEGNLTVNKVMEKLKSNLIEMKDSNGNLKYPEATQYVTSHMGFKFWKEDPHFQLDNHVRLHHSQGQSFTQKDLRDLMELLLNQPFHSERSPWEILVVNNYTHPDTSSGGMTVMIFKFHHCLADGFGAMNSFITAIAQRPPVVPKPRYVERRNIWLFMFNLTYPIRVVREISQFVVMSLKDSPWKIRDEEKAWKLLYSSSPIIPVGRLKEIKNHFGVLFASVIHSCLGSAFEKSLEAKYGVKKALDHGTMPALTILPLPGHPLKFRNFSTGVGVYIPTGSMDSIDRLRQCDKDLVIAKTSTMPFVGKLLPVMTGSMFHTMAGLLGKNRSFPVCISNFPFSETPFEIDGMNIVNIQSVVGPGAGVAGLVIFVHSYVDGIQVSMAGEMGIFSKEDLDQMIKDVMEELEQLYSLCVV